MICTKLQSPLTTEHLNLSFLSAMASMSRNKTGGVFLNSYLPRPLQRGCGYVVGYTYIPLGPVGPP